MSKNRIIGILISFALMLTMMPATGLSMPSYADDDAVYGITQTASPEGSGSMSVKVGGTEVTSAAEGADVDLAAQPAAGYALESVSATYDVIASVNGLVDVVGKARFESNDPAYYMIVSDNNLSIFTKDGDTLVGSAESVSVDQEGNYYVKIAPFTDPFKISLDSYGRISSFSNKDCTLTKTGGNTKTATDEVKVRRSGNDWTFKMPAGKVEINAEFTEASNYPLWVGGTRVTSTNAANITGGDTVTASYTPATTGSNPKPAKLTLNNYNYKDDGYEGAAIYAKEDLTIELKGSNSIESTDTTYGKESYGINLAVNDYIAYDLTICGSGSLDTGGEHQEFGIFANCITINSGTVTANGFNQDVVAQGVKAGNDSYQNGNITINGGTLNAPGGSHSHNAGIIASGDITINDGNVTAASTGESGVGIYALGNITIEAGEVSSKGPGAAICGKVKNSNAGKGWTDTEGTQGEADISISSTARELTGYKKVQFLAPLGPVSYLDWDADKKELVKKTCENYTVVTSTTTAFEDDKWYVVNGADVRVNEHITVGGTAHLILKNNKSLTAYEGIGVASNKTLNIYAQSTGDNAGKLYAGVLNAKDDNHYAGIGGEDSGAAGNVTINGGRIVASGYEYQAGIGGGVSKASAGTVTINGGSVEATGGIGAAGIGGGAATSGGTVIINDGTVKAYGGSQGSGIGGGQGGSGGTVTINGGSVTANGGTSAAGIGGGGEELGDPGGAGGSVTVNDGNVTATGGTNAAGIGGGNNGAGGTVVINSGSVTAACGSNGNAAIGSGKDNDNEGTVTLSSDVKVKAGSSEANAKDIFNSSFVDSHNLYKWAQITKIHTHSFTYAAGTGVNANTITATCSAAGCNLPDNTATLTITAPDSLTYDGNTKEVAVTNNIPDLTPAVTYTKTGDTSFTGKPKDAGTYTASVMLKDVKTGESTTGDVTASVEYTIAKADLTDVSVAQNGSLTYSGSAQTPDVTATATAVNSQPVSFTYSKTQDGTYGDMPLVTKISDCGTFYYKASAPNHNDAAGSFTVTMNKGTAPEVIVPAPEAVTYDANKTLASVALPEGWSWADSTIVPTVVKNGYDAALSVDDDNYDYSSVQGYDSTTHKVTRTVTLTVNKANPTVNAPTAKTLTETGSAQGLVNAGTAEGGKIEYALGKLDHSAPIAGWGESIPEGTNAGTYYVWYKVTGDDNHKNIQPTCVTVTIAEKPDPTPPTPTPDPEPTHDSGSDPAPAPVIDTVTVNTGTVNAKALSAAVAKAGGSAGSIKTIILGKKVKKISKGTFKNYKKAKTLVVKTKKLKKAGVKNSLKGSKITKIKVQVGNKKTNKTYLKKYKKIFTKKNAGRKAIVK